MIGWLILIGIFVVPGLIGWIAEKIGEYREAERSKQRDEIAINVISEYGLTNDEQKVVEESFGYVLKNLVNKPSDNEHYELTAPSRVQRNPYQLCRKCGIGYMVRRQGKYGYFLGCSNYSRCTNTMRDTVSNKRAKNAEKDRIAKEFMKDLEKAYN